MCLEVPWQVRANLLLKDSKSAAFVAVVLGRKNGCWHLFIVGSINALSAES